MEHKVPGGMDIRSMADMFVEGVVVYYNLRPKDRPTHPEREWRGRVKRFIPVNPNPRISVVLVEVLDPGYEGDVEYIEAQQVTRIEKEEDQPK